MLDVTPIQSVLDIFLRLPFLWIPLNLTKKFMMDVLSSGPVPGHLGLIMDGNRRFAKKRGIGQKQGHTAGAESLSTCCFKLGISEITVFAFSIENFSRPQEEIDDLFELLTSRLSVLINADESLFRQLKIRVKVIGNKALLPEHVARELAAVEEKSLFPDSQKTLNICTPYTSRDDIANSIKTIAIKRKANGIAKEDISTKVLDDNMYFGLESRPLDILIRTSGHNRLSDFLLWQCTTRCSIEFVNTLWPDFKFLSLFLTLLKWSYYKQLEINDKKIYKPMPKPEPKFVDISMLPQSPPFASNLLREAN